MQTGCIRLSAACAGDLAASRTDKRLSCGRPPRGWRRSLGCFEFRALEGSGLSGSSYGGVKACGQASAAATEDNRTDAGDF